MPLNDSMMCRDTVIPVIIPVMPIMIPVMIPVMTSYDPTHSRNLIILLTSHKKGQLARGMGGSDGCRYDALLIVVEYQN